METAKKSTALAVMEEFRIANRYEGLTKEDLEDLMDQMEDLDPEREIPCRKIKIPAGGGTSYEVEVEDDGTEPQKTITGVVVFTHRLSGYWPNGFGSSGEAQDKFPECSSIDGSTGIVQSTGEVAACKTCPRNQYGTAVDQRGQSSRGKACKNMRRLYLLLDGDPNLYLLTVPPTSIRDVNKQLSRMVPYTDNVVTLSLEKSSNSRGITYSKVILKRIGRLPREAVDTVREQHRQLKAQYLSQGTQGVTLEDCIGTATRTEDNAPSWEGYEYQDEDAPPDPL